MTKNLLGKNSKLKNIFKNPNYNLKNRCHTKIIFSRAVFQLLSKLSFFLKLSMQLNNSISWQPLLFDQIKASRKYKQVIKIWITIDCYFMKIFKMMLS